LPVFVACRKSTCPYHNALVRRLGFR